MRAAALLLTGCTTGTAVPAGTGIGPATFAPARENVLVVVLDDVGVDKLGAYRVHPTPSPTPVLDALVDSGVRFDRAYGSPTCSPTRASILTGRTPSRHGIGEWLDPREDLYGLPDAEVTFAELARGAGWSTAAVGKWHVSVFDGGHPERDPQDQGFDHYRGVLANPDSRVHEDGQIAGYYHWERVDDGRFSFSDTYLTTAQADDARDLVRTLPEPWVLYVAFNAPHIPFHVPPPALATLVADTAPDTYDAMTGAMDTELGRFLDGIDPEVRERTTVVVVGDNGTPGHSIRPPWNPLYAKATMTEGGIRIPLAVSGPRVREPGAVSSVLVHATDVFATVAEIVGVDVADLPFDVDGQSLLPYVDDPSAPGARSAVLVEQFGPDGDRERTWLDRAVVGPDHKLVRRLGEADQLTAVTTDPSDEIEVTDDAAREPLRVELERWEAALR